MVLSNKLAIHLFNSFPPHTHYAWDQHVIPFFPLPLVVKELNGRREAGRARRRAQRCLDGRQHDLDDGGPGELNGQARSRCVGMASMRGGAEQDGEAESFTKSAERWGLDGEKDGERTTMARLLDGNFLPFH